MYIPKDSPVIATLAKRYHAYMTASQRKRALAAKALLDAQRMLDTEIVRNETLERQCDHRMITSL